MKSLTTLIICACAALALIGCGSSTDKESPATGSSATPAPTQAPASAQDRAASQVCSARDDIQTQVQTLTSLSTGSATNADVTAALGAIQADLKKIENAQPDLAPERKQQVQNATTAFGSQLKDVLKQTLAGITKHDAKTQATNAAASLNSAVKESLQPIDC